MKIPVISYILEVRIYESPFVPFPSFSYPTSYWKIFCFCRQRVVDFPIQLKLPDVTSHRPQRLPACQAHEARTRPRGLTAPPWKKGCLEKTFPCLFDIHHGLPFL